jgi:MFS family permease
VSVTLALRGTLKDHAPDVQSSPVIVSKRQLAALFYCSLVLWTVGNGLIPLLPVYVRQLGAGASVIGYSLSVIYLALATGTIFAGWLSDRFRRRKPFFIMSGVGCVLALWLVGRAGNVWVATSLFALAWFFGGMGLSLLSILTGVFAPSGKRGRIFGLITSTGGLGALAGGLAFGPIADLFGYSSMFAIVAIFSISGPLIAFLLKEPALGTQKKLSVERHVGVSFMLLLVASTLAGIALFVALLGRSLVMNQLAFNSAAISSTAAIGGAVTLPLPLLFGVLSDRVGRKRLLAICYAMAIIGMLSLAVSSLLWHFWIAISFLTVLSYASSGVGYAFVTDLTPREYLGRNISLYGATTWLGGIVGFAIAGVMMQTVGSSFTFLLGAILLLVALFFLMRIRQDATSN